MIKLMKLGAMCLLGSLIICMCSGCGAGDKYYNSAQQMAEKGDYTASLTLYKKAIENNPDKAEYYIGYGLSLCYSGNYDEALTQFKKAYQQSENSVSLTGNKQVYYGEELVYYAKHDYENAIKMGQNALKINKLNDLNKNIRNILAASYSLNGDTDKALTEYNDIIKEYPDFLTAYMSRASYYEKNEQYDKAESDYQTVIKKDDTYYDAYFSLYYVYVKENKTSLGTGILDKMVKLKADDSSDMLARARAYYCMGDYTDADTYFNEAIKAKNYDAYYYMGIMKMKQEKYDEAIEYLKKTLGGLSNINIGNVYNQMAGCEVKLKDYAQASSYIESGIENADITSYYELLKNQVIIYEKNGDYSGALTAVQKYLSVYPDDSDMAKEEEFIKVHIK